MRSYLDRYCDIYNGKVARSFMYLNGYQVAVCRKCIPLDPWANDGGQSQPATYRVFYRRRDGEMWVCAQSWGEPAYDGDTDTIIKAIKSNGFEPPRRRGRRGK